MPARALTLSANLDDWKLVYRILHSQLTEHLELMDTTLLHELQTKLQEEAQEDGVDVGHHAAWDVWLGNADAPGCEDRVARRRTLRPDS